MGFANSFLGESFLTLWDGDCEFLGCRKAFLYTGEVPPTHASSSHSAFPYTLKEETRREEGKRERERHRERESEIEETDKNSHQVLEIDETWCDLHSWLFATTTSSA